MNYTQFGSSPEYQGDLAQHFGGGPNDPERPGRCEQSGSHSRRQRSTSSGSTSPNPNHTHQGGERDWPVTCLVPGCKARPFKRVADLDRHYRNSHGASEEYGCDYPRCLRAQEPFRRRDPFRDHLRDYHREDICKRGAGISEAWFRERQLHATWWRCSKCLNRVIFAESGYFCRECQMSCERNRQEYRGLDVSDIPPH